MKDAATRRLVIATAVALPLQWLLAWLLGHVGGIVQTPAGFIDFTALLAVTLSMAVGGWIGGPRFTGVAIVITALVWIATLIMLLVISQPLTQQPFPQALASVLRHNGLAIVASLALAALGAAMGNTLRRKLKPLSSDSGTP